MKEVMKEAQEELKKLLNELFVADLRQKADNLGNTIATNFEKSVNEMKDNFLASNEEYLEPKFDDIQNKFNDVIDQIKQVNKNLLNLSDKNSNLIDSFKSSIEKKMSEMQLTLENGINENKDTINNFLSKYESDKKSRNKKLFFILFFSIINSLLLVYFLLK